MKERCNGGNNAPKAYVVIRNTLRLDEMYVSEPVWEEVKGRTNIRPAGGWEKLNFGPQGNLTPRVNLHSPHNKDLYMGLTPPS